MFQSLLLVTFLASVAAECPNACSGHGICGKNDMCVCDRNFQDADCSGMTCPMHKAHTMSPQGDLNNDGDRDDNSYKRLSVYCSTMDINSHTLTLSGLIKRQQGYLSAELAAGDLIRVGEQTFEIESISSACTDPDGGTTCNAHNADATTCTSTDGGTTADNRKDRKSVV